jgi:hypothetical protein
MGVTAFEPLANMTPELDALMHPAGPCAFCGGPDKRHRVIDAIRERVRAGGSVEDERFQYEGAYVLRGGFTSTGYPAGFVDAVLALRPVRVQRSRAKGARMPWGARYVGRPSRWGNPFAVGECVGGVALTPERSVQMYAWWLDVSLSDGRGDRDPAMVARYLDPLRDATALACWCPLDGPPCHADVLLELLA